MAQQRSWRSWFSVTTTDPATPTPGPFGSRRPPELKLESLEDRAVPATSGLDVGFGPTGNGRVLTHFGSGNDTFSAMARQADGKYIAVGSVGVGTDFDVGLARYRADGKLDTTFGDGGLVTTKIGSKADGATGVTIQPDGKIVVVGYSAVGDSVEAAALRYNVDGKLDRTFGGGDGMVTVNVAGQYATANSVALTSDGGILMVGAARGAKNSDLLVVKFNPDGTVNTNFGGNDGIVTQDFGAGDDAANEIKVLADGRFLVAGYASTTRTAGPDTLKADRPVLDVEFAVLRFDADGSLDKSFAGGKGRT
ncbi:MAG: delta-60 repeat domain-containing protein, partial [Planctomycetia bacterium]